MFTLCSVIAVRPSSPDVLAFAAVRSRQRMLVLDRLADVATSLLKHFQIAFNAEDSQGRAARPATLLRLSEIFARVNWALCLIIALQMRLLAEQDRGVSREDALASPRSEQTGAPDRMLAADLAPETDTPERDLRPAVGSLDAPQREPFSEALLARPFDDLIVLICRKLGLPPNWPGLAAAFELTPADIDDAAAIAFERQMRPWRKPPPDPPPAIAPLPARAGAPSPPCASP